MRSASCASSTWRPTRPTWCSDHGSWAGARTASVVVEGSSITEVGPSVEVAHRRLPIASTRGSRRLAASVGQPECPTCQLSESPARFQAGRLCQHVVPPDLSGVVGEQPGRVRSREFGQARAHRDDREPEQEERAPRRSHEGERVEQVVRRLTATAHVGARSPSSVVGAGSVDPVAALTGAVR